MGNKRDSLLYNADGYYDPTAGESLKAIMSNSPSGFVRWRGQPVYICTPEVPTTEEQCTHLERFCRFVARQGAHPISPFLFYSEILDLTDRGHVRSVLRWTRGWLRRASEIWILGNSVPWNLRTEVNRAMSKGKAVRFFQFDGRSFRQVRTLNDEQHGG